MPVSGDVGNRFATPVTDLMTAEELKLLETAAKLLRGDQSRTDWEATSLAAIRRWRTQAEASVPGALAELGRAVRAALLGAQEEGAETALVDLPDMPSAEPLGARGLKLSEAKLGAQLAAALQQAPRLLEAHLREAVRAGVDEVRAGKATRRVASQQVLDKLVGQGVTGFRDSAGRNWSLSSYTEMAVRTEVQARALAAGDERMKELGLDLVLVSDSPRECPVCRPFEGKVLSLYDLPTPVTIEQIGTDTPVPSNIGSILSRWVELDGSARLTRADRAKVTTAVITQGTKPPTRLYRGINMKKVPASLSKPGQAVRFPASSTSEEDGSALPYAENDDGVPVLLVLEGAPRGLSVSDRAESVAGYSEAEWIVAGQFYVKSSSVDADGVRTIVLVKAPPPGSGDQSLKKPLDMESFLPPEPPRLPEAEVTQAPKRVTRTSELTGESLGVDVYCTLAEARARGFQHPNCTHSYSAFIPGATKLEKPKEDPAGYDAKQQQRALERQVRSAKRAEALALSPAAKAQAKARVRDRQAQLRTHVKDNGLKRLPGRESITKAV